MAIPQAEKRIVFRFSSDDPNSLAQQLSGKSVASQTLKIPTRGLKLNVAGLRGNKVLKDAKFTTGSSGLGISGGATNQVDAREALVIRFDKAVIVESVALVAGEGACGGFYQIAGGAPLVIYCVDGDIDAQDQSGILSDLGVLKAGQPLRLDSSPHFGVEAAGQWRLATIAVRIIK